MDIWARNGGLYLGFPVDQTEGPPPRLVGGPPLQLVSDRMGILYGPNGSGKSRRNFLFQHALLKDWSTVVVDVPKGELTRSTAAFRRDACGNIVDIIDPYGVSGMLARKFNPVAALDPSSDDFVDEVQALSKAVVPVTGSEPHWATSGQDGLSFLTMFSRFTDPDGGSLVHVRRLLGQSTEDFAETVRQAMRVGVLEECPELVTKAARFRDMTPDSRELQSILSTMQTATQWIDSRPISRSLSGRQTLPDGTSDTGDINFAGMKEVPTTTYICLPGNRLFSHEAWLKLVMTAILQALLRKTGSKVPVLLLLDEASLLGGLEILERSMAALRGYGVKILSAYQDVPQARLALGKRHASYQANAGVLFAFAPQDADTAAELSRRSGQITAPVLGYSGKLDQPIGAPDSSSISISQAKVPGMLPQDLMNMDMGYGVAWTHQHKGTLRLYLPDPSEVPGLRDLAAKMG